MRNKSFLLFLSFFAILILIACQSVPMVTEGILECDTSLYPAENGNVDLFNAVKAGDFSVVKGILEDKKSKVNINVADRLGQSALMWACWNGDGRIINELLDIDKEIENQKIFNPKDI